MEGQNGEKVKKQKRTNQKPHIWRGLVWFCLQRQRKASGYVPIALKAPLRLKTWAASVVRSSRFLVHHMLASNRLKGPGF
ncbi:hypothetical protein SCA6_019314 [Theobroma cacao]